jgi:selenocysteine-specific translation elongation factor
MLHEISKQEEEPGKKKKKPVDLPPIQLVLTKCDLVTQVDLARRVVQVREQLSDSLRREPAILPVMVVSAKPGIGFNNISKEGLPMGGVLELQKELAALVPQHPSASSRKQRRM